MASLAFRFYKISFRLGFRPGPRWGAYDAPPEPSVGCGWGYPSPFPTFVLHLWHLALNGIEALALSVPILLAVGTDTDSAINSGCSICTYNHSNSCWCLVVLQEWIV